MSRIVQSLDRCRSGILDRVFTGERPEACCTADEQLVLFCGLDIDKVFPVLRVCRDGDGGGSIVFSPGQALPKLLLRRY